MKTIQANELPNILKEHDIVILKIGADWCGPCIAMHPVLKEYAKTHPDQTVLEMDCDQPENEEFCESMKIRSIPHIMVFYKGKLKRTHVGMILPDKLEKLVQKAQK